MKRGELCRMHKLPDLDNLQGTILPGAVVLGELLGQGGMGTVYRGRQTALNRDVCVKFLALELLEQRDFVKRFYREGQILSRLSNPHVVEVYCIASLNDVHPYMVMEWVEGRSLRQVLQSGLNWRRACKIVAQICKGVCAVHAAGFVHRDLKPDNVIVTEDNTQRDGAHRQFDSDDVHQTLDRVKIIDFGLVGFDQRSTITATGAVVGSVYYMAPESFVKPRNDPGVDIYAIGCILYECLAGVPPFTGSSVPAVAHAHYNDEVPPLPVTCADVHVRGVLQAVVSKACAKSPSSRFASAADFAACLEEILESDAAGVSGFDTIVSRLGTSHEERPRLLSGRFISILVLVGALSLTVLLANKWRANQASDKANRRAGVMAVERSNSAMMSKVVPTADTMVANFRGDLVGERNSANRQSKYEEFFSSVPSVCAAVDFSKQHVLILLREIANDNGLPDRERVLDAFLRAVKQHRRDSPVLCYSVELEKALDLVITGKLDDAAAIVHALQGNMNNVTFDSFVAFRLKLVSAYLSYYRGNYSEAYLQAREACAHSERINNIYAFSGHAERKEVYLLCALTCFALEKSAEANHYLSKVTGAHTISELCASREGVVLTVAMNSLFWECAARHYLQVRDRRRAAESLWLSFQYCRAPCQREKLHAEVRATLGLKAPSAAHLKLERREVPNVSSLESEAQCKSYLRLHESSQTYGCVDPLALLRAAEIVGQVRSYEEAQKIFAKIKPPYLVRRDLHLKLISKLMHDADWVSAVRSLSAARGYFDSVDAMALSCLEIVCLVETGHVAQAEPLLKAEVETAAGRPEGQVPFDLLITACVLAGSPNDTYLVFDRMSKTKYRASVLIHDVPCYIDLLIARGRHAEARLALKALGTLESEPLFKELRPGYIQQCRQVNFDAHKSAAVHQ